LRKLLKKFSIEEIYHVLKSLEMDREMETQYIAGEEKEASEK